MWGFGVWRVGSSPSWTIRTIGWCTDTRQVGSSVQISRRPTFRPQAAFRLKDPDDPTGKKLLTPRKSRDLAKHRSALEKLPGVKAELLEALKRHPNGLPLAQAPLALRKMTRERQTEKNGDGVYVRKGWSAITNEETEKPDRIMLNVVRGLGYGSLSAFIKEEMGSVTTVKLMASGEGRCLEPCVILKEYEDTTKSFHPRPTGTPNPRQKSSPSKPRKMNAYRRNQLKNMARKMKHAEEEHLLSIREAARAAQLTLDDILLAEGDVHACMHSSSARAQTIKELQEVIALGATAKGPSPAISPIEWDTTMPWNKLRLILKRALGLQTYGQGSEMLPVLKDELILMLRIAAPDHEVRPSLIEANLIGGESSVSS